MSIIIEVGLKFHKNGQNFQKNEIIIDKTKELKSQNIGLVGLCLTCRNVGIENEIYTWKGFRVKKSNNNQIKKEIDLHIQQLLQNDLVLGLSYVFEPHKNGVLHSHLLILCPLFLRNRLIDFLTSKYGEEAVTTDTLSPNYLYKSTKDGQKMTKEWSWEDDGRVKNQNRIVGVQKVKKLEIALNKAILGTSFETPTIRFLNEMLHDFKAYQESNKAKSLRRRTPQNKALPVVIETEKTIFCFGSDDIDTTEYEINKAEKQYERELKKAENQKQKDAKKTHTMRVYVENQDGKKEPKYLTPFIGRDKLISKKRKKIAKKLQKISDNLGFSKAQKVAKRISEKYRNQEKVEPKFAPILLQIDEFENAVECPCLGYSTGLSTSKKSPNENDPPKPCSEDEYWGRMALMDFIAIRF